MVQRTNTKRKPPAKRPPPERMLSITEAAARLGVSRTQARRYMESGQIDYGVYPSGRRMLSEASVARFIERAKEGRL